MRPRPQCLLLLPLLIFPVLWLYLPNFTHVHPQLLNIQQIKNRDQNIVILKDGGTSHNGNGMYICATMDWWPSNKCDYGTCSWINSSILNVDLNNTMFKQAARNLAPFYLRIGGTLADQIIYDVPGQNPQPPCMDIKKDKSSSSAFVGGCLTMPRWQEICDFCSEVGCKIVFGLNYMYGRKNEGKNKWSGKWDPSNTMAFLNYTHALKFPAISGFELGNQLTEIIHPREYAQDLNLLGAVIEKLWPNEKKLLLGPDSVGFNNTWISQLIDNLQPGRLDAITHHKYQLGPGSDTNLGQKILDVNQLDNFYNYTEYIHQKIMYNRVGIKGVWVGEAGGAWNSGRHGTTDAFISGIWYNDELGAAAENLHNVFCRQTLVGGNYGLLKSTTFEANPDYYSAFLWNKLMGSVVLKTTHKNRNSALRIFAHCNKQIFGSVSLLIINAQKKNVQFFVEMEGMDIKQFPRREYHLTSYNNNYNQQTVLLNGGLLKIGTLEMNKIQAQLRHGDDAINMAPVSFAFVEFLGLDLGWCKKST